MSKPTEDAQRRFEFATHDARVAGDLMGTLLTGKDNKLIQLDNVQRGERQLAYAVAEMCSGLARLSIGLRATYMLLEDVNRRLGK